MTKLWLSCMNNAEWLCVGGGEGRAGLAKARAGLPGEIRHKIFVGEKMQINLFCLKEFPELQIVCHSQPGNVSWEEDKPFYIHTQATQCAVLFFFSPRLSLPQSLWRAKASPIRPAPPSPPRVRPLAVTLQDRFSLLAAHYLAFSVINYYRSVLLRPWHGRLIMDLG